MGRFKLFRFESCKACKVTWMRAGRLCEGGRLEITNGEFRVPNAGGRRGWDVADYGAIQVKQGWLAELVSRLAVVKAPGWDRQSALDGWVFVREKTACRYRYLW